MGRPYKQELAAMQETYDYMEKADITQIMPFFTCNCNVPLLIIGSGGSYAVAKAFELCYQSFGGFAKAITPFSVKEEKRALGRSKVLIVTAGGNNPDTVAVYDYVRLYEPEEICVICMSKGSKIAKAVLKNGDALLFEESIPFGKDGYLAVNSSIAMFAVITKLMELWENAGRIRKPDVKKLDIDENAVRRDVEGCDNFIVLYGGWGTPAAYDLESKCSEAGLISTQFIDYRNFAHGRHNWIDKHMDSTAIVALTTPADKAIRDKTLDKLPVEIPRILMSTKEDGILAALELLIQVFYFVGILGDMREIDPGRPHVPDFGGKLYNIKHNLKNNDSYIKMLIKSPKEACIYRKMKYMPLDRQWHDYYSDMYDRFTERLYGKTYKGIILDFDGTLTDKNRKTVPEVIVQKLNRMLESNIVVAFATGRGDSVAEPLREIIRESYWDRVMIGFYNGSRILNLHAPDMVARESSRLTEFYGYIAQNPLLREKIHNKGFQLSVREKDACRINLYYELLSEIRINRDFTDLQIFKSDHAVDVIEADCGKQRVVEYLRTQGIYDLLCIGDEGRIFENDYEMLAYNFGISSNRQNLLGESGWNLAPLGVRNVAATRFYFEKIQIEGNGFRLGDF